MVKNPSTQQKTVKTTLIASQNDIWSIDKTLMYINYMDFAMIPIGTIMDDYYDYFETILTEVEVPEKYYYSPTGFAEYYYGDPELDFLVMYFGKILSLFEFNKPKIKVFPVDRLRELNKLIVFKKKEVAENKANPPAYTEVYDVVDRVKAYDDYFRA